MHEVYHSWTKTWPFVPEVKGDPYKFLCTVCGQWVACDQGKHDVEQHIGKAMHQANAKSLKGQSTINFQAQSSPLNEQVSISIQDRIVVTINLGIGHTC